MARKPRIELPGALYHVIARGNNGQDIFNTKEDYLYYLDRLHIVKKRYGFYLFGFCLMSNHIHLLIQTNEIPLSRIMRALQTSYARFFNRNNNRVGHLFQNRYKAILCDIDTYLLELVRYIHLNPVRAGLVEYPQIYPWSSHRNYIGSSPAGIVDLDLVIGMFGSTPEKAVSRFNEFVLERLGDGQQKHLYKTNDQRFLGDNDFMDAVSLKFDDVAQNKLELRQLARVDLKDILTAVARQFKLDELDMVSAIRSRKVAFARHILIYISREEFYFSGKEVAKFLKRDDSSISFAIRKVRERMTENLTLKAMIDEICSHITS